ncbi:AraC-like DNA-binding protein/predicted negative regulator of RcsB-dependent stress response [Chryseobacterium sediminis]|uniref:AraC-like DNA-binding protein/predicted negative regulator of RcsB-dependent stress response n=1 Tax=Chryseobacterium sediminis TaxID=1679494 RepID=A0ABR6Q2K1_9FLAO|nr:helix-turn-helix domain-containing protein [Chryseobacterium sediminis]MBB6331532.1 AraC-like DNA-binding protein/predicted negative regulator of RcsB-dependent stress response [Chryseobacterium sediminis]
MMKIKLLLLFLIIGSVFFHAQTHNIEKNIPERRTYEELEKEFYGSRIEEGNSKSIADYYLKKAKSEKNIIHIAEGYVMLHFEEDLPNALKYLDSLQYITRNSKENTYPARIYLLKGNLYFRNDNLQSALNNYILGLKYAKEKGNKRQIAMAHISIAYLNNYIGKHAETAKVLRHYAYDADYMNKDEKNSLKLNLADAYIEINKMDSAYALIQEGLQDSKKNKDNYRYHQNLGLLGYYNLHSKNYQKAIDGLLECEKYFFTNNNGSKRNHNYTLLYLGKSYAGLQEKEKAVGFFRKIDSLVLKTNYIYPELREVYTYLIDYYKENDDKEKQLYYVDRFFKVDKVLDTQFRYISRELPRRYDTPELQQEKEDITNELTKRKSLFYIVLSLLLISHLLFINVYFKYKKSEKNYKKIAQDLIQSVNENRVGKNRDQETGKEIQSETLPVENTENSEERTPRTISEDIAQTILKELDIFESKDQFLNKGITLGSLAKKIKTNSKYLSEIINTYKGKNFATYLNDLRIDYAISRLANDKKFRSYKIPFIAEELGYNNEQAFTLAFKKRTGTPLSIYLKEIENMSSN